MLTQQLPSHLDLLAILTKIPLLRSSCAPLTLQILCFAAELSNLDSSHLGFVHEVSFAEAPWLYSVAMHVLAPATLALCWALSGLWSVNVSTRASSCSFFSGLHEPLEKSLVPDVSLQLARRLCYRVY